MGVRRLSFVFFCSRSAADLPSCIVIKKARPNSWNTSYRIGSRLDGFDRVTLRCPQGVYRVLQLPSFGFRGVHRVSLPMEKPVVLERSSSRDVYGVERSIEKTKKQKKKTKKKETTSHWTAAASNQMARPFFIGSFRNGPSLCSSATSMPPIANVRTYRVFTEFFFP